MVQRHRLDAELVRRNLARSREAARSMISQGEVLVAGSAATKPATMVATSDAIVVRSESDDEGYVSRGGHKLAGAFDAFEPRGLTVEGRRCLDAGASTGGFTDVLLRRGAARVVAVDVGYGQLAWSLRSDDRVDVRDRTNVRDLSLEIVSEPVDVVVADLSFISLRLVLDPLFSVVGSGADVVLMVKPQFEVGRERVGKKGVVRDRELRASAVLEVARAARERGFGVAGVVASPLPGPSGNVEYFLWLRADAPAVDTEAVYRAINEGPQ